MIANVCDVGDSVTLLKSRRVAAEPESATNSLKRSALRLEVIELRVQIVDTEPERVSVFEPRKVRRTHILVVSE